MSIHNSYRKNWTILQITKASNFKEITANAINRNSKCLFIQANAEEQEKENNVVFQ